MEIYRLTGAISGLILSGGISLFFFFINTFSSSSGAVDIMIIYLLIPPMVLWGFIFDTRAIWRRLAKISQWLRPSYPGAGFFWAAAWPVCKIMNDLLYSFYVMFKTGQFALPSYFHSLIGLDGLLGLLIYQAIVGTGMGFMFFMVYRSVFSFISVIRQRLGVGASDYELTIEEEFAEFGFRK